MASLMHRLLTLLLVCGQAFGDYDCVCNYNVETEVYAAANDSSKLLGYMYEFDCKPQLELNGYNSQWVIVAFEHQTGFVKANDQVMTQTCTGNPGTTDVLTTTSDPLSTDFTDNTMSPTPQTGTPTIGQTKPTTPIRTTPIMTTTTAATTTPNPTTPTTWTTSTTTPTTTTTTTTTTRTITTRQTTAPVQASVMTNTPSGYSLGNKNLCSASTLQFSTSNMGYVGQFETSCYVIVPQIQHWPQAQQSCRAAGGHLVDISKATEQDFVYNFLRSEYPHSVWTGLNDGQTEGSFQWSSGQPFGYTNWAVHNHFSDSFEDCVVIDTRTLNGQWDDRECSFERYSYICEFGIGGSQPLVSTTVPGTSQSTYTDGSTDLCSSMLHAHAARTGGVLGQYGKYCYELLMNTRMSWEHAENTCSYNGGHLVHVTNAKEQAFIDAFMSRHNPNHAVWIGLHDTVNEGQFQWTSGDTVQYTNWISGNVDNTLGGHNYEDCVALVPQRGGKWDDVTCGFEGIFGGDSGEIHYAFCQYHINPTQVLVG